MGSSNEIEVVLFKKHTDNIRAEDETDASVVFLPAVHVLLRVGPEQIAEKPGVRNVGRPHNSSDLLHVAELGGEPAVHAEDLLVDDGSHGKAVEAVREGLPQLDVVPSLALVVEPVNSVDRCSLVVPSQQEEVLRVFDFVREQQADRLQRLLASIDVVA